jgi:SAM-dependent methyltransferase
MRRVYTAFPMNILKYPAKWLRSLLAYPLTRGMHLDDPRTTLVRRDVLQKKKFLKRIYQAWYTMIAGALPDGTRQVVELGAGAGFLAEILPDLVTSEVFFIPGMRAVLDGQRLPFAGCSLKAVVMTDVFHHLAQPRRFLAEAARSVVPGGVVIMVEPWVSAWSRFVYRKFHHEPFDPQAAAWEIEQSGPLTAANGALPWIIFERDRQRFEAEFPQWSIEVVQPMMPFLYLLSGGMALRSLAPGWMFEFWQGVEKLLAPWMGRLAMFAFIVLRKQ